MPRSVLSALALALLSATTALAEPAPALPRATVLAPTPWRATARGLLDELVAIDSTHAKGSLAAAQWGAAKAKAAGFPAQDVVVIAPPGHPTKANLLIRLRGKGLAPPLMVQGHLDVVEVDRAAWTVDPFKVTPKEGWLYGRGVEDMKGDDVLGMTALFRMNAEGFVPDRDILLALTADEEGGGDANGPKWLFAAHPELMKAGIVLNIDGGGPIARGGRPPFAGVETAEKLYATYRLSTQNAGGHSSEPRPDNAIYQMTAALERIAAYRFPVRTNATTRAFFASQAKVSKGQEAADFAAVARPTPDVAAAERLARDPEQNAILRTTCVATEIKGGQGESALPNRADATVQCRLFPGETPEATQATLARVISDPQVKITIDQPIDPSPETDPDPRIIARVQAALDTVWPGMPALPFMSAGASDMVYSREAGIPSYSSGGIVLTGFTAHGRDERITAQAFDEGVQATYALIKAMSAKGP